MKTKKFIFILLALLLFATGLLLFYKTNSPSKEYVSGFSKMNYPIDNQSTNAKIELGRQLFFDKRLSADESVSCATCHVPEFAFTDRLKFSEGVNGHHSQRNAPTLLNVGYQSTFMFDAHIKSLEEQAIVPIQDTNELAIKMGDLINRLKQDFIYQKMAKEIFKREFDAWVLTRSLAAFQRTLVSDNSRFDQYYYQGIKDAMSQDEIAGWKLFSEELYCVKCHPAPHFTNFQANNNGLYSDYGEDKGRFRIHNDSSDIGSFKVPTLRNITLTYPYMHDGSFSSLESVIEHYQKGGEKHFNQSEIINEFHLSNLEKQQLILFFDALVDTSIMYSD